MFAGSSITYGRRIGGKDPEQSVCLGNKEVWKSKVREEGGRGIVEDGRGRGNF